MKKSIVFAAVLVFVGTVLSTHGVAVQSGGGPAQPWSKTCDMGGVGSGGCDVTVTMTASSNNSCPDNGYEYCVTVSVSCPGDPEEDCSSDTNCNMCGTDNSAVALTCDGQCFSAKPKSGSDWDSVASDCGCLSARDSGHPCN